MEGSHEGTEEEEPPTNLHESARTADMGSRDGATARRGRERGLGFLAEDELGRGLWDLEDEQLLEVIPALAFSFRFR